MPAEGTEASGAAPLIISTPASSGKPSTLRRTGGGGGGGGGGKSNGHGPPIEHTEPPASPPKPQLSEQQTHGGMISLDDAMDRIGHGRQQYFLLLLAGLCFFSDSIGM